MDAADDGRERRVAWLLNHTTLRAFEVPLIRSFGLEVWTSKQLFHRREFASASVSYAEDKHCTMPEDVLELLNGHNFYEEELTSRVASALNGYFGTVICLSHVPLLRELTSHYRGRILLRVFGREHPKTYRQYLHDVGGSGLCNRIREIQHRFWFAPCYDAVAEFEEPFLRQRSVTLPLGIPDATMRQQGAWVGGDNRLLFLCPRITTLSAYYGAVYRDFKKTFGRFPHLIAGEQPQPVDDPAVAGFVPEETLNNWLNSLNVMYYHSREPRHLHYHPLEAIVHGMPVIYLRGGLMDALGGADQPGACANHREAQKKVARILEGDQVLVQDIREKQQKIIETFTWDYNRTQWQRRFVEGVLRTETGATTHATVSEKKRIAVILPKPYRGGTLRATKDLARMIKWGSTQRAANVDVVLSCPRDSYDFDSEFADIKQFGIPVRPLEWKSVRSEANAIAEITSGGLSGNLRHQAYALPSDGCNDFLDCDLWLFVSDRVEMPVFPIRPYGAVIFDYIQRYVPEIFTDASFSIQASGMIPFVQDARFVMVTTPATGGDLNAHAGVSQHKIARVPPFFELIKDSGRARMWKDDYFIWVCNSTPHKNQVRVLQALEKYYDEMDGQLKAMLVGPQTDYFSARNNQSGISEIPHVARARSLIANSPSLRRNLQIHGELPEPAYACAIKHARFLLHSSLYDNGTFSVIDAASLGVRSLASRYPALEYFDELCRLNLTFFDPYDVNDLAESLKAMEVRRDGPPLPDRKLLEQFHWKKAADAVCDVVLPQLQMVVANAYR